MTSIIDNELWFSYIDIETWEPTEHKYVISVRDIIDNWFGDCVFLRDNESEVTHATIDGISILAEKYALAEEFGWTIEVLLQYLIDATGYRKDEQVGR